MNERGRPTVCVVRVQSAQREPPADVHPLDAWRLGANETGRGERAEWQRCKKTADSKRTQVNREVADPFQQLAHLSLCIRIVSGIEHDALAACDLRLCKSLRTEMVEGLHNSSTRHRLAEDLSRMFSSQVDRLDAVRCEGVA
jgi:hypothetical protein